MGHLISQPQHADLLFRARNGGHKQAPHGHQGRIYLAIFFRADFTGAAADTGAAGGPNRASSP